MNQELESAADALAAARLAAGECADLLAAAIAERDNILSRISIKEADRSAIVSERRDGAHSQDHAGRLALLTADLEGLGQLLVEDQESVARAQTKSQASNSALAAAEKQFERVEDEITLLELVDHADAVGVVLVETASEMVALCKKLGQRNRWAPSRALADQVRFLDLNRTGAINA